MKFECLTPSQCGIGNDCSNCHEKHVEKLDATIDKLVEAKFRVSVQVMKESHQTTYWVCLDKADRPLDAMPWDGGRITPFKHTNKEYAEQEAKDWAEFLGVALINSVTEKK